MDEKEEILKEFESFWKSLPPSKERKVSIYRRIWKILQTVLDHVDDLF